MNCRYGFMRATRRLFERSTALMFANMEFSELGAPDAVDSVREISDQLAFAPLGMRTPGLSHDGSFGGGGGGAMDGFGEGGGTLKPPTKGSAIGPISSTGWNLPSGPLNGALHRASSWMRVWRSGSGGVGAPARATDKTCLLCPMACVPPRVIHVLSCPSL